jgi:endo-1,4-beta-D-glucanase Y
MKQGRRGLVIGLVCLAIAGAVTGTLAYFYKKGSASGAPLVFSTQDMLQELWTDYKKNYLEQGTGRTLDIQRGGISTSEGESYTMLRAVWMDDEATFKQSWQWTKDNLQRDDHVFSWKFGKHADGTYGVLESEGGQNSAADGDSDIALGLLMAYSRWKNDDYYYDALPIIQGIWEEEVVDVNGQLVLTADNLEKDNPASVLINPSYLSPYAYKLFAHVDKEHDWNKVAQSSYAVLGQAAKTPLDTKSSAGLPPDWMVMDRTTGNMRASDSRNLTTDYSYDAIRTPWRLALDYKWTGDARSKELLAGYSFLGRTWHQNRKLAATYTHDGTPAVNYESLALYGASMGYYSVQDPAAARQIYQDKLLHAYNPDFQGNKEKLSYYDDNWVWFGLAMYLDQLPNLAEVH